MYLTIITCNTRAQTWQQIGPGAGGQLRALYEHPLPNNKFDLYVGSDVSAVWKASNLDRTSFDNTNTQYEYLSNHRIFRFVNKFVHSPLLSDKLFAVSRGGIDIIDLNGVLPMTQVAVELSSVAVDLSESWVSDMHIAPGNATGEYKVWFVTGNSQLYDNEKKSNSIDDFYYGTYYASTNNIVLDGSQNLLGLFLDRNAYCLQLHQNNTAGNLFGDYLLIGTKRII